MQMNRDSVTLRENPCSSKNIREIRTELNEHGGTRKYTDAVGQNIRKIREIRTEQITNTETHGNTRMQMDKISVISVRSVQDK